VTVGVVMWKVDLSLCLINYNAIKTHREVEVQIHVFLTSTLDVGEWSASRPDRFHPAKKRAVPVERRVEWLQSRSGHASYLPCNRNQIPGSSSQ